MTVVVTVKHLSGDNKQEVNVSFGEQAEGYKRCIGAASSDPFQENDPQATVRLLIAAAMQVLDNVVLHGTRSDAARLANTAKTQLEIANMLAVKALYEQDAARANG